MEAEVAAMSCYWIQTFTGKQFDLVNPHPDMVCIRDIAHALSNLCRFTGHVTSFYSVAQHSIIVSEHCDQADALAGLLHDAAEAYIGDANRPLKQAMRWVGPGDAFGVIEDRIERAISDKFGLPNLKPPSVERADMRALVTESMDLLPGGQRGDWQHTNDTYQRLPAIRFVMTPLAAESQFIGRFRELTRKTA